MAWKFGELLGMPNFKENGEVHYIMNFVYYSIFLHKNGILGCMERKPLVTFQEKNLVLPQTWASNNVTVATPLWGKCEVATHTPENGTWEPSGTPKNSECDCRGQNTSHWGVLYIVGKVLKYRCPKWPRMGHLYICSTSYGRKNGRESN